MNASNRNYWIAAAVGMVGLCCCCLIIVGAAGLFLWESEVLETADTTPISEREEEKSPLQEVDTPSTPTPFSLNSGQPPASDAPTITPAPLPPTPTPSPLVGLQPPPEIDQRPIPSLAADSLPNLWNITYPNHDYYNVAVEFGGQKATGRTVTAAPFALNDTHTFWVDGEEVEATLLAMNDYAYFWVVEGVDVRKAELTAVAERFQDELYPAVTAVFGREWNPGIDGDPRLSILHIAESSGDELGYFTSTDQYPRTLFSDSNEQEMLYMNMGQLEIGEELYYGTLVHELQHLIHWNNDGNETSWLDEGLAQLTEHLLGFDTFDVEDYISDPNLQFNTWDNDDSYPYYAAGALFSIYFSEQLGETAVTELVTHPADGLSSVRALLAEYQPGRTLEQFIADWYVANYVRDEAFGPQYDYEYRFSSPRADATVGRRPWEEVTTLAQYGVRYIDLDQPGDYTISFAGDTLVELLAITPPSGQRAWLSPGGDGINATLTAPFDLTSLNEADLAFWAWFELEEDYDYGYLLVSADDGQTWEPLDLPNGSRGEYGSAFNGYSTDKQGQKGGWIFYSLSLDEYAGQEILVRFQILTDASVYERGFAVDDIAVPQLGFLDDVEGSNTAVWEAAGFAPSTTTIPQQWAVQLIEYGRTPRVTTLPLDAFNQGRYTLTITDSATLVIAPMAPHTTTSATYWLKVE